MAQYCAGMADWKDHFCAAKHGASAVGRGSRSLAQPNGFRDRNSAGERRVQGRDATSTQPPNEFAQPLEGDTAAPSSPKSLALLS